MLVKADSKELTKALEVIPHFFQTDAVRMLMEIIRKRAIDGAELLPVWEYRYLFIKNFKGLGQGDADVDYLLAIAENMAEPWHVKSIALELLIQRYRSPSSERTRNVKTRNRFPGKCSRPYQVLL